MDWARRNAGKLAMTAALLGATGCDKESAISDTGQREALIKALDITGSDGKALPPNQLDSRIITKDLISKIEEVEAALKDERFNDASFRGVKLYTFNGVTDFGTIDQLHVLLAAAGGCIKVGLFEDGFRVMARASALANEIAVLVTNRNETEEASGKRELFDKKIVEPVHEVAKALKNWEFIAKVERREFTAETERMDRSR